MQRLSFTNEIQYLLNPHNKKIPDLVFNLNLILDKEGMFRSGGRIDECDLYDYGIIYHILLPNDSHLTKLIILDCHEKFKHLISHLKQIKILIFLVKWG